MESDREDVSTSDSEIRASGRRTHARFNTGRGSVEASMGYANSHASSRAESIIVHPSTNSSMETSMGCNAAALFNVKSELVKQNRRIDDCSQEAAFTDTDCEQDREQMDEPHPRSGRTGRSEQHVYPTGLVTSDHSAGGGHIDAEDQSMMTHTGNDTYPYACPQCSVAFMSQVLLQNHVSRAHTSNKTNPTGTTSNNTYPTSAPTTAQEQPEATGNQPYPYKCQQCPVAYMSQTLLTNHITRMHTCKKLAFKCSECPAAYTNRPMLTHHVKITHQKQGKKQLPHKCQHCPAAFKNRRSLEMHAWRIHQFRHKFNVMRTHSVTDPFSCQFCPSTFKLEKSLHEHVTETHIQEDKAYPYCCSQCPAAFKKSISLKAHISKTHAEVKVRPYSCPKCPETFQHQYALKSHIRMYAGVRHPLSDDDFKSEPAEGEKSGSEKEKDVEHCGQVYTCTQCAETFSDEKSLKTHVDAHNREKPYPCPFCDASYAYMIYLKEHIAREHAGTQHFECSMCPAVFTDANQCVSHIKLHSNTASQLQASEIIETHDSLSDHDMMYTGEHVNPPSPIMPSTHLSGGHGGGSSAEPNTSSYPAGFPAFAVFDQIIPTHVKLYPFSCSECPAAFQRESLLTSHIIKTHRGKRREDSSEFLLAE